MNVAIDGNIYERTGAAGITRTYDEILPRICELDAQTKITLVTSASVGGALPTHTHITHRTLPSFDRWMRPRRLWRQTPYRVRQSLLSRISAEPKTIWHSTYYSLLPNSGAARIVSVYDMIHELFPSIFAGSGVKAFQHQKRHAILEADCLLCISHTTRHDVCEFFGIDPEKTRVTPLAPSPIFQPLPTSEEIRPVSFNKPYFLYVGARWGYKNFDCVLSSIAAWPLRHDFDLRAVGPPWTQAEKTRLRDLGLEENVFLHTGVDDGELRRMYCHAVAFIHPSLYEGFGIPILEAMACGCPVVASQIPSSIEIAGECALFFVPNQPASLATALDGALISETAQRLARAGPARAAQYSWNRTAGETLAVYREMLTD